jgi:hypothetical protein
MATEAGSLKIEVPNFTNILLDSIKGALIAGFHKLPYSDTPYYLYALYGIGGFVLLMSIFWYWKNFIR